MAYRKRKTVRYAQGEQVPRVKILAHKVPSK